MTRLGAVADPAQTRHTVAMLVAQALVKHYGSRTLFADVHWRLQRGERVGLIGANGAGKTTLLRLLAGAEVPDGGHISLGAGEQLGYLPQEAPRAGDGSVLTRVMDAAVEIRGLLARQDAVERALPDAEPQAAAALAIEHAELCGRLNLLDGYALEARAREVLAGLGFAPAAQDGPIAALSGGWWMRVELARLLLTRPDFLLLDEPTNHLDAESLAFVEQFLGQYAGAWVVVSHDRFFLNRCVNRITELGPGGLTSAPGSYDQFVAWRAAQAEQEAREAANVGKQRAHLESFVTRFGAKASKAAQAQSRRKALARLPQPMATPPTARRLEFALPEPPRAGTWLVHLEGVHKHFGHRTIFAGVDLQVRRGQRIAIVGPNGAGKSTLLKLLAGAMTPDRGHRHLGHNVVPYYFAQHQLDVLDPAQTVLAHAQAAMPPTTPIAQVRGLLGAFLFSQDAVTKTVGVLSGGEKSRLVLACMFACRPNLLLLDEPTNHLDLHSRDTLEAALCAFAGTIVCISHDRYFLSRVAEHILEVTPGGQLDAFSANYSAYLAHREARAVSSREPTGSKLKKSARARADTAGAEHHAEQAPRVLTQAAAERGEPTRGAGAAASTTSGGVTPQGAAVCVRGAQTRRGRSNQQKELATLERIIAAAEARRTAIDALLCDPDVYADASRSHALLSEREAVEAKLGEQMQRWEILAAAAQS